MICFKKEEKEGKEEEEEADCKPSIVILEQPASHQHRFPHIFYFDELILQVPI